MVSAVKAVQKTSQLSEILPFQAQAFCERRISKKIAKIVRESQGMNAVEDWIKIPIYCLTSCPKPELVEKRHFLDI